MLSWGRGEETPGTFLTGMNNGLSGSVRLVLATRRENVPRHSTRKMRWSLIVGMVTMVPFVLKIESIRRLFGSLKKFELWSWSKSTWRYISTRYLSQSQSFASASWSLWNWFGPSYIAGETTDLLATSHAAVNGSTNMSSSKTCIFQ